MTPTTREECIDLRVPGYHSTHIEIDKSGQGEIVCPCCQGDSEHRTHFGNEPASTAYPCSTCQGRGALRLAN